MNITLATKFTIARIILIVPTLAFYVAAMYLENLFLPFIIVAAILFAVLCATDFIDGHIARSTNTVSDLGKFLDPLADKVVIVVMLFLIVYYQRGLEIFPYNGMVVTLLSALVLSRELMISVFRSLAARKGLVLAADIYGKIKTVFLDVGVSCLILAGTTVVLAWIGTVTFYIGAVLAVYSAYNYIVKNKQVFAPDKDDAKLSGAQNVFADKKESKK
jgi:CDP-diacylglycerol--glycerol-3-phosphate 3-phosphatidyltransferase